MRIFSAATSQRTFSSATRTCEWRRRGSSASPPRRHRIGHLTGASSLQRADCQKAHRTRMHFSVTDVRREAKRTAPARTRHRLLMAALLAALAVGLGTAGWVAAQSSDLAVGGLSSGPASNGGNADSSSGGANGLQLGGANSSGAPKAAVAGKDYN